MASKASKVTADTPVADIGKDVTAASPLTMIEQTVTGLTQLGDALGVRSFEQTLAIKRRVGELLTFAVKGQRTAGMDAGKVGADGAAITFAHVAAATGNSGLQWQWGGRKRATLSDDLNAWHSATPARVKAYRALSDANRVLGKTKLSLNNAQHAVQWCHRDANPGATSNRSDGAQAGAQYASAVTVTGDDRKGAADMLKGMIDSGGESLTRGVTVKHGGKALAAPDIMSPVWLASLTSGEIEAAIVALEGERKRRAIALKAGKVTTVEAPSVPSPQTAAAAAEVAAAPAVDPAMLAAIMAAMSAVKA